MLNEILILQTLILITLIFFISTYSLLTLWYLAGLYLVFLGLWQLWDDGDIFIGFLWVIDLGVGLVFFLFILHYSSFLNQKANVNKSSRELSFLFSGLIFLLSFLYFFTQPIDKSYAAGLDKSWFFFISWYDYYDFFFAQTVTDLNLLREIYFFNNSWEFFIINFLLFYSIINSILISFFIKRCFVFLNYDQYHAFNLFKKSDISFFIRSQDFTKQQYTASGTRVWTKRKNL